ncbi:MAG: prepilin peptidase [Solirubrobacterales bacterium]|nr:prepilin peptidase [Solirubrobacterales bacterium]
MPDAAAIAVVGIAGLLVGSFLNVVAYRVPRGESVVRPRSRCPSCGHEIRVYDNVPIVSWLALRGRCRDCGAPVPARYPLVEAVTGAAFAAVAAVRGIEPELALYLPFAALMVVVAAIDLEHRIVPNRLLAPAAVWALAAWAAVDPGFLPEALAAGAGAFGFLLVAALAYPAGMGMGDVKLAGAMGLYLGLSVVPALLVAFLAGSVVGLAIVAREGRDARKKGVPFAPFLALGGLVGALAGPELIELYSDRFL